MSNRFHSKYHRHNHHTDRIQDPKYPDASHDPIASPDSPFLGDFVLLGTLSAMQLEGGTNLGNIAGSFVNPSGLGLNVQGNPLAIQAVGDASITGSLSAFSIEFTGDVLETFNNPITATGEFLLVNVMGNPRAIRLWNYL